MSLHACWKLPSEAAVQFSNLLLDAHTFCMQAVVTGVDARLAVAEAALSSGELRAAAEAVERAAVTGSAAETAAAAWVRAARERAAADQSLRLLRAHATALAASVA